MGNKVGDFIQFHFWDTQKIILSELFEESSSFCSFGIAGSVTGVVVRMHGVVGKGIFGFWDLQVHWNHRHQSNNTSSQQTRLSRSAFPEIYDRTLFNLRHPSYTEEIKKRYLKTKLRITNWSVLIFRKNRNPQNGEAVARIKTMWMWAISRCSVSFRTTHPSQVTVTSEKWQWSDSEKWQVNWWEEIRQWLETDGRK